MLQTGDRIQQIEGVFSGTLSYLFNTMSPDLPFSAAVQQAKDRCEGGLVNPALGNWWRQGRAGRDG